MGTKDYSIVNILFMDVSIFMDLSNLRTVPLDLGPLCPLPLIYCYDISWVVLWLFMHPFIFPNMLFETSHSSIIQKKLYQFNDNFFHFTSICALGPGCPNPSLPGVSSVSISNGTPPSQCQYFGSDPPPNKCADKILERSFTRRTKGVDKYSEIDRSLELSHFSLFWLWWLILASMFCIR